jgi:hypothetical protein
MLLEVSWALETISNTSCFSYSNYALNFCPLLAIASLISKNCTRWRSISKGFLMGLGRASIFSQIQIQTTVGIRYLTSRHFFSGTGVAIALH